MASRCKRGSVLLLAIGLVVSVTGASEATIVYCALRNGSWQLYAQSDPDSDPMRIEGPGTGDRSAPAISPDRRSVAFEVQGEGIYRCSLESPGRCSKVHDRSGVRPVWHPKTSDLFFVRYTTDARSEDSEVFRVGKGSEAGRLLLEQTGIVDYPDVSADGRWIAYTASDTVSLFGSGFQVVQQLWVTSLESGLARQLLVPGSQNIQPDWSPSGERIAFASNRSGSFEIWVVGTDGTGARQLTTGPGTKTWPAWSPDGRSILFTIVDGGRHGLALVDADGSGLRRFEPFGKEETWEMRDADWR